MEKELTPIEKKIIKVVGNFILVNRFKIYFLVIFCVLLVIFSRLPFFNLIFSKVINFTLILLVSILLFKLSAKKIFSLLVLFLALLTIVSLLDISSLIEKLSSIAFVTFISMVIKLIIEYKE